MATADPFFTMSPERVSTWGAAVNAMEYALYKQSRQAWRIAAQWWDQLAALHSPTERDREIYRQLAVQAWVKASERGKT